MGQQKRLRLAGILFFGGLLLMISTVVVAWIAIPALTDWIITKVMRLEPGNMVWTEWFDLKAPLFLKVYIFNVTNHNSVLKGAVPKLHEIGPYVYEQTRKKEFIKQDYDKGTVTFRPKVVHHFRPDLSNGSEDDLVVLLNTPFVSVAHVLSEMPRILRDLAHIYLDPFDEQPFLHTDIKTILFNGIHFPMIESVSEFLGGKHYLPNNTFAFFKERNITSRDIIEVDTGVKDHKTFGEIRSWMGSPSVGVWNGPSCNMINGSDATLFAPFVEKDTILRFFISEFCRSFRATFEEEEYVEGIPVYRYSLAKDIYENSNPDNQCFCSEADKSQCPKSGIASIAPCRHGAPIYISNPHFLYADPSYGEPFHLKPDPDKHEFRVFIEPKTGVVVKGNARFQLNAKLKKSDSLNVFAHVPEIMVPLLWVDEGAALEHSQILRMRFLLVIPVYILLKYGKWIVLALSFGAVFRGIFLFLVKSKRLKTDKLVQIGEQESLYNH